MWSTRRAFGQEAESGVIRADQTRVRVRSGRIHKECGHEVPSASADGAASIGRGEPGGLKTRKKKRSKKRNKPRKGRPVETDTSVEILKNRIPTEVWKAQDAFHSSHKARRRSYLFIY